MKPLQAIAMGLVVITLVAPAGGVDLLADPLGWVLVLLGVSRLPEDLPLRTAVRWSAALAALASLPLAVPAVVGALDDAEEGLAWAADLPRLACYALLSLALARAAYAAGDRSATAWWRTACGGVLLVVALPVLVFGGGLGGLEALAGTAVAVVPLGMVVLLFAHAGRAWAGAPTAATGDSGAAVEE